MTERTKHARKATSRVSYVDSLDSNASDSGEEEPRLMKQKRVGKGSDRRKKFEAAEDSDDENDEDFGTKKRKPSRGKSKSKAKKVRKGLLKTLPAELIAEILSYCHTGDILSLYATSKTYRALLGSKTSAPIWRKSRLLIGLPDVPVEGFSELHYAQLIFGKKCELCGKGSNVYGDLSLRIRFCRECRNDHYVKLRHLAKTDPDYHPLTSQVVPYTTTSAARCGWSEKEKYALRGDLDAYSEQLFNLENEDDGDLELLKLNAALGKRRRSSTRARTGAGEAETAVRGRVERFVEEKKLEIAAGVVSHKAYGKWRVQLDIDQQNALVHQALHQAKRVCDPDFDFDQPSQGYEPDRLPWDWKWFTWLCERVRETEEIEEEVFETPLFRRSKVVKHIQHMTDAGAFLPSFTFHSTPSDASIAPSGTTSVLRTSRLPSALSLPTKLSKQRPPRWSAAGESKKNASSTFVSVTTPPKRPRATSLTATHTPSSPPTSPSTRSSPSS